MKILSLATVAGGREEANQVSVRLGCVGKY